MGGISHFYCFHTVRSIKEGLQTLFLNSKTGEIPRCHVTFLEDSFQDLLHFPTKTTYLALRVLLKSVGRPDLICISSWNDKGCFSTQHFLKVRAR